MTETTNDELNRQVLNYNPTIKRARLPGPMQLRENFESNDKYSPVNSVFIVIIACAVLGIIRSKN